MSKGDPQQFNIDITKWVEKAKAAPMAVVRETIQMVNNEIVATTPVKTGFLRGSYAAAINTVPAGTGSGGAATAALNAVAAQLRPGDTYVMGNTAAYARRVEYGFVGADALGRNYNQKGRYWMRAVLANVSNIAMEAATRVAGGAK
jgi:hypothetical protein